MTLWTPMSCFLCPQEAEAEDGMPTAHAGRVHSPRRGMGLRPGPEAQAALQSLEEPHSSAQCLGHLLVSVAAFSLWRMGDLHPQTGGWGGTPGRCAG